VSAGRLFIGVDLGRTTRAAVVDAEGTILAQDRRASHLEGGRALVDGVLETVSEAVRRARELGEVGAVGVGVPGPVDVGTRRIKALPNLGDISDIDVHAELVDATGLPVILDNDANTAAYGEWQCGAARGVTEAVYVTIGTGIGAGVIQNGRLHRGAHGFAGEFGHFKIGVDGLECGCGSAGCLETVASGPNIVRRTRELLLADPRFAESPLSAKMSGRLRCEDVVAAAEGGDVFAQSVLSETGAYLGLAVANVINLLDAGLVVLGGPAMQGNRFLLERVRAEAVPRVFVPDFGAESVVLGRLGADAGVIGAAMMARDEAGRPAGAARGL
jgi:glucokinase